MSYREQADLCQGWPDLPVTHVVCVGNELARDDGIGIRVGRILRNLVLPAPIRIHFFQELGIDLVELLTGEARVIVVDALRTGAAPGTCRLLSGDEVAGHSGRPIACHTFGIAELFAIAKGSTVEGRMADVFLVGVEAGDVQGFSLELTETVRRALPQAVEEVLRLLKAPGAVVSEGRRLAAQSPAELSLLELHAG